MPCAILYFENSNGVYSPLTPYKEYYDALAKDRKLQPGNTFSHFNAMKEIKTKLPVSGQDVEFSACNFC